MRRSETACFAGHKTLAAKDRKMIKNKVAQIAEGLIHLGLKNFLCGGVTGFDTLAGFAVMELRERYPDIRLILILPCRDRNAKWTHAQKAVYRQLLSGADKIHYIADKYNDICILQCNRYMIDHSICCVAYLTQQRNGTACTVRLAKEKRLAVQNLAELNFEHIE